MAARASAKGPSCQYQLAMRRRTPGAEGHTDSSFSRATAASPMALSSSVPTDSRERATSIQEVLDRLLALAGVEARIERDPDRWRETDWLVGDASRLREATGWQPEIPLESILQEIYDDWCARESSS